MIIDWLESMHIDVKVTNNCSKISNLRSTCSICLETCKYSSITSIEQSIEIDSVRCNSCGECIIACPLSAITGATTGREFEQSSLIYKDVITPTVKELLIYNKRGIKTIQIGQSTLNQQWETILNKTNEILECMGLSPINVVQKSNEDKLTRRAFFTSVQREGKQLTKSMTPTSWRMEAGEWKIANYYHDYQFYTVDIDNQKCSLCKACISFCSEAVFSQVDSFLQIDHEKCVNCHSCRDICPEQAIQIKPEIKVKNQTNITFQQKECCVCGKTFSTFQPDREKCHICINRDPEWLSPF
ncbi:4Fe-4S binding protein [Neobacillus pocheonensis]|uniref:4Fe-4S binding protein n=1 Tax=Neobacillus pocheonensis TaxID=363869 RepID=UPI003D276D6B